MFGSAGVRFRQVLLYLLMESLLVARSYRVHAAGIKSLIKIALLTLEMRLKVLILESRNL